MPEQLVSLNKEELEVPQPTLGAVSLQLQHDIEQFYYMEAELLDDWKFRDWLELLAEDLRYLLPTVTNAQTRDRRKSVSPPVSYIIDDRKKHIETRIARLETGMAWAEEPPSRTKHLVTNVRIKLGDGPSILLVRSNFLVLRCQKERDTIEYVGTRYDTLRAESAVKGGWQIVKREIMMDQATLQTHNLTIFF